MRGIASVVDLWELEVRVNGIRPLVQAHLVDNAAECVTVLVFR